jgi:hypothetical protein
MQERGRKGAVTRGAESAFSDLQGWLTAAKKVGLQAILTEVDTNGDGAVVSGGGDLSNEDLATAGVVNTWVTANQQVTNQNSPWRAATLLWVRNAAAAADQAACNTASLNNPGQITICFNPTDDAAIQAIYISARDNANPPNLIYEKTISAD